MVKTEWDYSSRAATYDKRADYSEKAIDELLKKTGCATGDYIADVGAGTGKLTVPLLKRGLKITAVEPNDNMRSFGIKNTEGMNVEWKEGTGENIAVETGSVKACFFGSSFNVVDQNKTLDECNRILASGGHFACMWNHRDLDDDIQRTVETIIKSKVPEYAYGKRREDPTEVIKNHSAFGEVGFIEDRFIVNIDRKDWIEAWHSHATLARQAGEEKMKEIIDEISEAIGSAKTIPVPYFTRIWYSKKTA